MGCQPSKRAPSSSSWFAADGWVKANSQEDHVVPQKSTGGKIRVAEPATERERTGEESLFQEPENRDIGDGMLGVADSRSVWEKVGTLKPSQHFQDEEFPPDKSALFYSEREDSEIEWKVPRHIVSKPKLLVDGISRDDIMQGILGDCWFLSSCAAIAQKPEFMRKVIPDPQPLYGKGYKGIVHFRFWRFGGWIDVYVDDMLPVKNETLLYAHNSDATEFWVALLEKAYAKLHGSYEAIEGGQAMDALVDLTGGLAERYELHEHTQELYQKLARAAATGAFITCSRKGDWKSQSNAPDEFGLIAGHAYTVTSVKRVKGVGSGEEFFKFQIRRMHGNECLLRIRNPWGMGEEWKGAWCDKDDRWGLVDEETKGWLQFVEKDDGEFWMCYKDFVKHFQEVTICTVGPDFDGDGEADKVGKLIVIHGKWEKGTSAGGSRNDIYAFGTNPQFLLTVHEADERDESLLKEDNPRSTSSILIGLMQEYRRSQRHIGVKMLQIGFLIYKTDDPDKRLPVEHFMYNYETAKSGMYVNFREVCGRYELEPGHYIVIPTTYNKDDEGTFLLRVFAAKSISLKELPDYNPDDDDDDKEEAVSESEENPEDFPAPLPSTAAPGEYPFDPNGADYQPQITDLNEREPSR